MLGYNTDTHSMQTGNSHGLLLLLIHVVSNNAHFVDANILLTISASATNFVNDKVTLTNIKLNNVKCRTLPVIHEWCLEKARRYRVLFTPNCQDYYLVSVPCTG